MENSWNLKNSHAVVETCGLCLLLGRNVINVVFQENRTEMHEAYSFVDSSQPDYRFGLILNVLIDPERAGWQRLRRLPSKETRGPFRPHGSCSSYCLGVREVFL